MRYSALLVLGTMLLLLTACDSEQSMNSTNDTTQMAADTGPEFDLLETPVGTINFATGCMAEAAPLVERGVALMHHMMYDEARLVFSMANDKDSGCAMAYWGEAMTYVNPLWPGSAPEELMARGLSLVETAKSIGGHDDREKLYIKTAEAYYIDGTSRTEPQRLKRLERAYQKLHESYPDDLNAKAYYALSLISTSDMNDPELSQQRRAGELAFEILAVNPDHPGAHHYVIHAYDNPTLAGMALTTADKYGTMTPRVPHATHMMTHTYTRLGLWDKAIEWNSISAETALAICIETGEVNLHYTHALDYLAYAYLQKGDDDAVMGLLNDAKELKPPYAELNRDASAYSFSALPARYALERRDWEAAAKLKPRMPASFPWEDRFDRYVAITYFANALAKANLGDTDGAEADIITLHEMHEEIEATSPYWAKQVQIQEITARAWQVLATGDEDYGLSIMKRASELEATTDKSGITPGEVLPAAELYGDMLLKLGKNEEALEAYRVALNRSPGRYNSLYGATKAAMAAGDNETAKLYATELIKNAGNGSRDRESLGEAKMLMAGL